MDFDTQQILSKMSQVPDFGSNNNISPIFYGNNHFHIQQKIQPLKIFNKLEFFCSFKLPLWIFQKAEIFIFS